MRQIYQLPAVCMARSVQILAPAHDKVGPQFCDTIHHLHYSSLVSWNHLFGHDILESYRSTDRGKLKFQYIVEVTKHQMSIKSPWRSKG